MTRFPVVRFQRWFAAETQVGVRTQMIESTSREFLLDLCTNGSSRTLKKLEKSNAVERGRTQIGHEGPKQPDCRKVSDWYATPPRTPSWHYSASDSGFQSRAGCQRCQETRRARGPTRTRVTRDRKAGLRLTRSRGSSSQRFTNHSRGQRHQDHSPRSLQHCAWRAWPLALAQWPRSAHPRG